MNTSDLDQLQLLCASLEQVAAYLFEESTDDYRDVTILELTERHLDRAYQDIDPDGAYTVEDWQQVKGATHDIAAGAVKAGAVTAAATKKFILRALAELDHTARVDFRNTEATLVKAEGDGQGQIHQAKLAARLSMQGQPVQEFVGMFDELMVRSRTIVDKLLPPNEALMNELSASLKQMTASPEEFQRKGKLILKTMTKIQPMEKLLEGPVRIGHWPGGFTVSRKAHGHDDFDLNKRRQPKDNPGIMDVLSRSECEVLLKQVSRFIQTNRQIAERRDHGYLNSASWHAMNLRYVCGTNAAKAAPELRTQLIAASQQLKLKIYLDNHLIVRRLLARNVEVIRHTLQYIRASIQHFR